MPEFNGLIAQYARDIQCQPKDFRTYLGERVRGAIATVDFQKWYLLKQSEVETWNGDNLTANYITSYGTEIDLARYQLDNDPFKKEHFYEITASPSNPKYKFKKMIILGAGASYDCLSSTASALPRLPVSNAIFKSDPFQLIDEFYPAVRGKFSSLGVARNLEEYLTKRWDRLVQKTRREELAELMNIQFYLHHLFLAYSHQYYGNKDCNYRALVEAISDYCSDTGEKVAVVSYNYDCLFEQAIEDRYGQINVIQDYIANDSRPVSIFKPHGSCDWVRPIKGEYNRRINANYGVRTDTAIRIATLATDLYKNKFTLADIHDLTGNDLLLFHKITREKHKYFQRSLSARELKTERFYWPNMLLPYNKKDEFVMPYFHQFHLDEVLSQVEEMLIIGWKGEERAMENKFKEKIGDRQIKVTSIGSPSELKIDKSEEEIFKNLNKSMNIEFESLRIGFSGFIKSVVDTGELFFQ